MLYVKFTYLITIHSAFNFLKDNIIFKSVENLEKYSSTALDSTGTW